MEVNSFLFLFSLQESRPFSVDFFRKIIQFEKEQVSVLSAFLIWENELVVTHIWQHFVI